MFRDTRLSTSFAPSAETSSFPNRNEQAVRAIVEQGYRWVVNGLTELSFCCGRDRRRVLRRDLPAYVPYDAFPPCGVAADAGIRAARVRLQDSLLERVLHWQEKERVQSRAGKVS